MSERRAAEFTAPLGGLEPAGAIIAQQRGQSPHTVAMWNPDGTAGARAASHIFFFEKKERIQGVPLIISLL